MSSLFLVFAAILLSACNSTSAKPADAAPKAVNGRQELSAPTLAETLKGYEGRSLETRVAAYNKARPEAQHIECETKAPLGSRMKKTLCYFKQSRRINERDIERAKEQMNRPR